MNKFTAEKVAIKIVDKRRFALVQTSRPDALLAEARILQSCEHECVVKPARMMLFAAKGSLPTLTHTNPTNDTGM